MFRTVWNQRRVLLTLLLAAGQLTCGCALRETAAGAREGSAPVRAVVEEIHAGSDAYFPYLAFQLQRQEGNLDGARESLDTAIALDPGSGFLKRERALLLIQQSRYDQALAVIEDQLRRQPDDVESLIIYGRINQGMKRLALAKEAYVKVLKLDPDRQNIYLLLGRLYLADDALDEARQVYSRLVSRFPESFAGHFYLGKIQTKQGDDEGAEKAFLRALAIKPGLEQPRLDLIELYRRTGKIAKIGTQFEALLANNPKSVPAALGYGLYLHEQGFAARAGEIFRDLGQRSDDDDAVFRILIRDYLEKKRYADAVVVLRGMLDGSAQPRDIHYLLGVSFEGLKKMDEALAQYTRIRPEDRFYPDAAIHAAYIYQELDRIDTGIAFLTGVIEHLPDKAEFRLYLGSFYEEAKEYEKAAEALKTGLDIDPNNVKIHFRLGVVYDKWGRKEDSIAAMKEVLRIDPKHANALNYLGYTYADLGRNLDEAEKLIQRALAIAPRDGYITDSLGWVYFKRGEFPKALEYIQRAVALVPGDPVILEHLGDVYRQLGEADKALDTYRRSLENKKNDRADLEKKIRDLGGKTP